jgi:hypothetical protein
MRSRFAVLAAALVASFACLGCANGQRLLEARIERDGETVLETKFGVSDQATPTAAWEQIVGRSFKAVGPITPDIGDPNKAVLKGKIRIALRHAGTHFASADVDQLRLTRVAGTDDQWEIPKEEVERTLKTAGFKE